ncbi:hypothetical protein RHGRI_012009 [Rhododendron griersonianum]|uniref:Cyclin N-terminal domain-containing protein n=1 Tax=Rhododendron griersonianum TaxID=479676 RepID=A0AAV6KQL1_9ERIC|nr:hypothetical protein RHGRI_012009 [Rhododendron griersonianum]
MDELDHLLHCDEGIGDVLDDELDDLLWFDEGVAIDDVKVDIKELSEILDFFKNAEVVSTLHGVQSNIDKDKHSRIVQWIVSICEGFLPATFFSCISLFDRTLVKGSITSNKLRLVAATSLLISVIFVAAAKENCRFFDFKLECMSSYLSELRLLDCSYMEYLPSQFMTVSTFRSGEQIPEEHFEDFQEMLPGELPA